MSLLKEIFDRLGLILLRAVTKLVINTALEDRIVVVIVAEHENYAIKGLDVMNNCGDDYILFGTFRELALLLARDLDARYEAGNAVRSSSEVSIDPAMDLRSRT